MSEATAKPKILTRIFVTETGDIVVTDLWDDVKKVLGPSFQEESTFCTLNGDTTNEGDKNI